MRFISTFKMGFKYLWRDPVIVAILVGFPIIIIFILGSALDVMFSDEARFNFDPPKVAAVAEEGSHLAMFLQDDGIRQFLDVEFTDQVRAEELMYGGYVSAVFIDQGQSVLVLLPVQQDYLSLIALTIIDSYQQIGAAATIAIMSGRDMADLMVGEVQITSHHLGSRTPSALDYYAVTMLVMILLFTGLNGMELFHKGLFSETGNRMRISPISKPALVGGLLAASTLTSFLQGMITFTFTAVVYGAYWGDRIPLVILTLFGMVAFSQALCIFLIVVFKKRNIVGGIVQLLFFVFSFVSGGFIPIDWASHLDRIFRFAPNALAQSAIFGAIYGYNQTWMATSLIVLFSMAAAFAALSFIFGRRQTA